MWTVVGLMLVAVLSMATLRHGMRLSLTAPVMAQSIAKSEDFQARAQIAFEKAKLAKAAAATAAAAGPKGKQLAEDHGCLGCHAENEKLVGPSYAEVAKKGYTAEQIIKLVAQPVPANWPDYPEMPPLPDVPAADVAEIASWINSLK